MPSIKHLFHINAPIEKVFKALSDANDLSEWYTSIVNGDVKLNSVITYEFVNLASF